MRKSYLFLLGLLLSTANGDEPAKVSDRLRVPEGFVIEPVAGPPLVDRPIVADLDELGRLYVADSSGSNAPVAEQLRNPTHRVVRLEDTDGDGRFDRSTVFADRLMFPEGAMWLDGSLYVAAPPSIWKLTDDDGDGVAERREEWFRGKTLTGCANDLHGPYLGPDGRIYWCKGADAEQTYPRAGRSPLVTRAAHIFRSRVDGSEIEPVMTGGMDNPVEVAFTPGGERIFTTTFLQEPEGGRRDGIIHDIYGGIYGKVRGGLENHLRTGREVMPVLVHLGPAAPSGLTRRESDAWGPDYRDNLFAALFNLRKVTRHVLTPEGSTFHATTEDFLTSTDPDFHPTDVLEDADGSLLVLDTGGWYKLCCPTSQLAKAEVLGAIYRIRKADTRRVDDPRGLKLGWGNPSHDELASRLDDPRPVIRRRATGFLARLGPSSLPTLARVIREGKSVEARRSAVWATTRVDHPGARDATRLALDDPDATVRQAALNAISLWRDRAAVSPLLRVLKRDASAGRRVAAEALGRIGAAEAVPALLDAAEIPADRPLDHALTLALIEIGDSDATREGLKRANPDVRRAALIALDQMPNGHLGPEVIVAELDAVDPELREAAGWIVGRHPEWASTVADALPGWMAAWPGKTQVQRGDLERRIGEFAGAGAVQDLLGTYLDDAAAPLDGKLMVLRALNRPALSLRSEGLSRALVRLVVSPEDALARQAVLSVRNLLVVPSLSGKLLEALLRRGSLATASAESRIESLASIAPGRLVPDRELFDFLRGQLASDGPVTQRLMAADVLAQARLGVDDLVSLTAELPEAGPLVLDRLLPCFLKSTEDRVGLALVEALGRPSPPSGLRVATLRDLLEPFGAPVKAAAEPLFAAIHQSEAAQRGRLDALLAASAGGDARLGREVFNGSKAACVTCHAIGYLGGKVGPDLTRIGEVRTRRDLLEAIAYPSASFVRGYEPVQVATKQGVVVSGVLRTETPEAIVLVTGPEKEARIAREEIDELRPGTVSVMPAGLEQQLTAGELGDLLTFLQGCR